jgi:hypothetical protein
MAVFKHFIYFKKCVYVRCILAATRTISWQMMGAGGGAFRAQKPTAKESSDFLLRGSSCILYYVILRYVAVLCYIRSCILCYYIILLWYVTFIVFFLWRFMLSTEQLKQQQACLRVDCPVVHSYKPSFSWSGLSYSYLQV